MNEWSFESICVPNNRKNFFQIQIIVLIFLQIGKRERENIQKTRHGQIAIIIVSHRTINIMDS